MTDPSPSDGRPQLYKSISTEPLTASPSSSIPIPSSPVYPCPPPVFGAMPVAAPRKEKKRPDGMDKLFTPKSRTVAEQPVFADADRIGTIMIEGQVHSCKITQDLEFVRNLGKGAFGEVTLQRHKTLGIEFASKKIPDESREAKKREQLMADLDINRKCNCPQIVQFYGFDFAEGAIYIFMEQMLGSFDGVREVVKSKSAKFPEQALGKLAVSVLRGLNYLKKILGVMHRDVKPSNILLGHDGSIKLCDFGISKQMVMSLLKSRVGSECYLAPERLENKSYDVRSDVWAFGLTLIELALLRFPYGESIPIYQVTLAIIQAPVPVVPEDSGYSKEFRDFTALCLTKDVEKRPKYEAKDSTPGLLNQAFILEHANSTFDMISWFKTISTDLSCPSN